MGPPGTRHGFVSGRIVWVLQQLIPVEEASVCADLGILLPSGNVRGADVVVISAERIRVHGIPTGWWPDAVDLAIEVVGADEREIELDCKIEEYFAAGVPQVWKVKPGTRKVYVYRSPKDVRIYDEGDELEATDVHPNLRFPVRRLFE